MQIKQKKVCLHWQKIIPSGELKTHSEFLRRHGGIYLWIYAGGMKDRVCYIGEAGVFHKRFLTHKRHFKIAAYTVYNLGQNEDWLGFVAEHLDGKSIAEVNRIGKIRIPTANHPTSADSSDEEKRNSKEFFDKLKFAFATLDTEPTNEAERRQVETALIRELRTVYKAEAGARRLTTWNEKYNRNDEEKLLGKDNNLPATPLLIEHSGEVARLLPPEFFSIVRYDAPLAPLFTGSLGS